MKDCILITRPEEQAQDLCARLNAKGYAAFCEPFLEVFYHPRTIDSFEGVQGLVFTSRNGVSAFINSHDLAKDGLTALPVYCVGDATADSCRAAGFQTVYSAAGNVRDLESLLEARAARQSLIYGRGQEISSPLKPQGVTIRQEILYHTAPPKEVSSNFQDLLTMGAFSYVLFFSRATARAFAEILKPIAQDQPFCRMKALCLSDSMIEYLSQFPWEEIRVAAQPDQESLLDLLPLKTKC